MPQGTVTTFEEFRKTIADGSHDLDNDTFALMLISNSVTGGIAKADATPDSADYTEVTGSGYVAGGQTVTVTWLEVNGVSTLALSATTTWTVTPGGPTDIRTALLYNQTHAGTTDAIAFVDLTVDAGTTAINLADGDVTVNAGDVFTLT